MKEKLKKVYNKSCDSYFKLIKNNLKKEKKTFIITANPEIIMYSENDKEISDMFNDKIVSVVPDGIAVVKAARMIGNDVTERITGVDIAEKLFEYCNELKKSLYLFGAKQEVIEAIKEVINKKYPNIKLLGATNGYVKDKDAIMKKISKMEPDVVMVALGVPSQEKLIYKHLKDFKKGIFVGVGGSFDVLSGTKKRAPKLFIKTNTEWLYRIICEPKRLKRFWNNNIKFLLRLKKEKNECKGNFISKILFVIFSIFTLTLTVFSTRNNLGIFLILLLVLAILAYLTWRKLDKIKILLTDKNLNRIYLVAIIAGIVLRSLLLCLNYYDITGKYGDYTTFYNNAVAFANVTKFNSRYIAMFPYLFGYISALGIFFKIFGHSMLNVTIFNIIMDLIGCFFLNKFLKNTYNNKIAKIGSIIWILNPINILWCVVPAPIIIVNTSILICLYVFSILLKNITNMKKSIFISILLGITLSLANCFRPIMIIIIISIFIYFIYLIINNKKIIKNLTIYFLLIISCFLCINKLNLKFVSNSIEENVATSASGWTIYLGSNYNTSGQWASDPRFNKFLSSSDFNANAVHKFYLNEGINRYKVNGLKNIGLFIKKSQVLGNGMEKTTLDSFNQIVSFNKDYNPFLHIIMKLYYYLVLIMSLIFYKTKDNDDDKILCLVLMALGFFTSNLLVEVASRYFLPVMVPLTLISIVSFSRLIDKEFKLKLFDNNMEV